MRSLSTKLLAAIAPTLAAFAILSGPASAAPRPASSCPANTYLGQAEAKPQFDTNGDGLVCQKINPAGKVIALRERPHVTW
jgi:hypothetical protein